ncbi:MAG TPA: MATE family efflux transporter [Tepidisphaeraceae bacterium]|jgi:putative MATE family efflux protein
MSLVPTAPARALPMSRVPTRALLRPLILLSLPVLAEHALHILVGLTDTYLANNLYATAGLQGDALVAAHKANASAGAAVGSITYIVWFIGLIVSSIGTGATAIIARAIGGRHRRLANKVCGQAILAAFAAGLVMFVASRFAADPLSRMMNLDAESTELFRQYVRVLSFGLPFAVVMFTASACLRGAGDTLTPAVSMMAVDVVNVAISSTLAWGLFGMPHLGFTGIAIGTTTAYVVGGMLQLIVLFVGRGGIRLFPHRLRPDWNTLRRILRIGIPSGSEGLLMWLANFVVLRTVNGMDDVAATAHNLAIRVESLSYMSGFAVAMASASLVGQALGAGDPHRANRTAYLGYGLGASIMVSLGVVFVVFSRACAGLFTDDPVVIDLAAECLFQAGFIQFAFAAAIIFGSSLRGAGDTTSVMVLNLLSIVLIRCVGAYVLGRLGAGLPQIWLLLCAELVVRGGLMYWRFATGRWRHVKV